MRQRAIVLVSATLCLLAVQGSPVAGPVQEILPTDESAAAPQPTPLARALGLAGAAVAAAAGSAASASMDFVQSTGRAAAQFGWELSFMLGVSTPPAGTPIGIPSTPLVERDAPSAPPAPVAAPPSPPSAPAIVQRVPPPLQAAIAAAPLDDDATPPPAEVMNSLITDLPRRESDGSIFVPKGLQRLLAIRTMRTTGDEHPVTIKLPGRVIPDPNAQGLVEASVPGRVEVTERGLPTLGQRVSKGEVLAYVVPAIGVVDRTQIRRDVARLTTEIRAATEDLDILQKFWFVPFREGKVVQARMHLEGLRRERAALLPLLDTREVLRAPTDGVVSAVNVVAGQVLQAGQTAVEIVNPGHLWIEASAANPDDATTAAAAAWTAAVTPEGQPLAVHFVGTGLSVQQQAALLHFEIDTPVDGLRVGRPVTVIAASRDHHHQGIAVPHDSVVNGPGGVDEVWEHTDAEHFRPLPVRTESLDGRNVLVTQGLQPGARVVVRSARLLAQYQ